MIRLNGQVVGQNKFPDGTLRFTDEELGAEKLYTGENVITWNYENDDELAILMCLKKHLSGTPVHLDMPYVPNARMDRVKTKSDVFTLKYFAEFINDLQFKTVKVLDPHSSVSEALFDHLIVESPKKYIVKAFHEIRGDDENATLFFPDEGAMKRYASPILSPFTFGVKTRVWETGEIKGLEIIGDESLIKNRSILIVDDICSRGGTCYHAAKRLKEIGATNIFLFVTHCEDTIHEGELLKGDLISRIYTTDSILKKPHEKIHIFERYQS